MEADGKHVNTTILQDLVNAVMTSLDAVKKPDEVWAVIYNVVSKGLVVACSGIYEISIDEAKRFKLTTSYKAACLQETGPEVYTIRKYIVCQPFLKKLLRAQFPLQHEEIDPEVTMAFDNLPHVETSASQEQDQVTLPAAAENTC